MRCGPTLTCSRWGVPTKGPSNRTGIEIRGPWVLTLGGFQRAVPEASHLCILWASGFYGVLGAHGLTRTLM